MTTKTRERNNYTPDYNPDEQASDAKTVNYKREKPEHRAEDRLEKFQEALDHLASKNDEKTEFRTKVAEDFKNEKNILEYPSEQRLKYMETYVEGFNEMDHTSFKERAGAAKEIAQNTFKHVYNEFEAVEANNAEKVPEDLRKIFKKEKITDFRYNEETGNIEFDFKDLKQLQRVAKKAGRQIHILKTDAEGDSKSSNEASDSNASGHSDSKNKEQDDDKKQEEGQESHTAWTTAQESHTAWMTAQEDHSVSDAKRCQEIKQAMNDFEKALLHSKRNPEDKAEKMNNALERAAKYVDMPEQEIDEQNNFKNLSQMEQEQLEERLQALATYNWDQVYETIDQSAVNHPEETESLRIAADAIKEKYIDSLREDFIQDQQDGNSTFEATKSQMRQSARTLTESIAEGKPIMDSSDYGPEHEVNFEREEPIEFDYLETIHDRAQANLEAKYADRPNHNALSIDELAIEKVINDLASDIEYLNNTQAELEAHNLDSTDNDLRHSSWNETFEYATNKARALQHMMGTRKESTEEEPTEAQPATA